MTNPSQFKYISLLIALFIPFLSNSQDMQPLTKAPWAYGLNSYYGGVLRYKPTMPKLDFTNLYGFEIYANKLTTGKRKWERSFNYPELGIGLEYYNYGIPELGFAVSATSYLDIALSQRRKHKWKFNIGSGFVYSSKRFDSESNVGNKAISSRISFVARATIHREFKLNEQYYLNVNLAFRHYSNGRVSVPNNGMNFPIAGIGLKYVPNVKPIKYIRDTTKGFSRKIHLNITTSTAWREVLREDIKHKAYSIALYLSRKVTKYNTLLLGVDGFYYDKQSMRSALGPHNGSALPQNFVFNYDGRQVAVTLGSELLIGKLSLLLQGGYYVYKPQIIYKDWYQRYGFKYMILNHIYVQTTLKAHKGTADMMEFGVGLKL